MARDGIGIGPEYHSLAAQIAGPVLRSWRTVVEDVYITGMGGDGLRITSLSANRTQLTTSQVNGRMAT